jgi:antitoxin YobK
LSWDTYQQAIPFMKQSEEECDFVGERTDELINKAENVLGFGFSKIYRDFVNKLGAGNFGSQEVCGVIDDDFENSSVPDAIWFTLTEREDSNLPNYLLVIYDTGMGELFCLNFKKVNEMGEPNVITYIPGIDLDKQDLTVIANDFGDFLLDLVKEEISY